MKRMRHAVDSLFWIACFLTAGILNSPLQVMAGNDPWAFRKNSPEESAVFMVARVISADLIELENGERTRLIGLKAPEAPRRTDIDRDEYGFVVEMENPSRPIEERAFAFAYNLLQDKRVRLEFDARKKTSDFYLCAYVFLEDGTFANAEILRQGFANLQLIPPNLKYAEHLRAAYREAREERRGLHGDY